MSLIARPRCFLGSNDVRTRAPPVARVHAAKHRIATPESLGLILHTQVSCTPSYLLHCLLLYSWSRVCSPQWSGVSGQRVQHTANACLSERSSYPVTTRRLFGNKRCCMASGFLQVLPALTHSGLTAPSQREAVVCNCLKRPQRPKRFDVAPKRARQKSTSPSTLFNSVIACPTSVYLMCASAPCFTAQNL